jgi:hypothetical protein
MSGNEERTMVTGSATITCVIAILLCIAIPNRETYLLVMGSYTIYQFLGFVSAVFMSSKTPKLNKVWGILMENQKRKNSDLEGTNA